MNRQHASTILADLRTRQRVDRAIVTLRRRRVSYRAISQVVAVYEGVHLTPNQIKCRCRKLGLPTDDPRGGPR